MIDEHHHLGTVLKENWEWITGAATIIWYGIVRAKRMLFRNYVTNEQLLCCKQDLLEKLEELNEKIERVSETNTQRILDVLSNDRNG